MNVPYTTAGLHLWGNIENEIKIAFMLACFLHKSSSVTIIDIIEIHFGTTYTWKHGYQRSLLGENGPICHLPPKISQIGLFPSSYEPYNTQYELYNCNRQQNMMVANQNCR